MRTMRGTAKMRPIAMASLLSALCLLPPLASAALPEAHLDLTAAAQAVESMLPHDTWHWRPEGAGKPRKEVVDYEAVIRDLKELLVTSKEAWPADWGHYGPLMVRMAWHCSGSYRESDGRGGCDGARQRFDPERSWPDNTNLDKARALLWPLKLKYGSALSFSDLMILAGTTAIEMMGGPVLGFCGGRQDDPDGSDSLELGPTPEQEALMPCPVNGQCPRPLGQSVVGLIYVNPEGAMGKPIPEKSTDDIRDVFGRMAMNDSETVALIGGGHAFGKAHGACPTGPGPSPQEDPTNPWPGTCGSGAMQGKGPNTFTSGFEGPWTTTPTLWSNQYYKNLLAYDWKVHIGPGGHNQWKPVQKPGGPAPTEIMMLTTDVALLKDPEYLELVKLFAEDQAALDKAFSHAWYKLVTRDMGPVTRCVGPLVPPAQPFQNPLPPTPKKLVNFHKVASDISARLWTAHPSIQLADTVNGRPYYGALFATLAWQCASMFRKSDYMGGCNGARIRFAPQKDWPSNVGMDKVLEVLSDVKAKYDPDVTNSKPDSKTDKETAEASPHGALSWADLIVLSGTVALRSMGVDPTITLPAGAATAGNSAMLRAAGGDMAAARVARLGFCGGRVDLEADDHASKHLGPREYPNKILQIRDDAKVKGITLYETVALAARPRSPAHQRLLGYSGSWTNDPSTVTNRYFTDLLTKTWTAATAPNGLEEYTDGSGSYMLPTDLAILFDPELQAIAAQFSDDDTLFKYHFVQGWTKMMDADRFDGPVKNVCDSKPADY